MNRNTPNPDEATETLGNEARRLGFELVGVAEAKVPETFGCYKNWIDAGRHAGMEYLARNASARRHPESVLEGVRFLLMLGVSYDRVLEGSDLPLAGVARYARGRDYHHWIRERLKRFSEVHRTVLPSEKCRGVVDTAPILERQFAVDAGLGTIGKNTMLIHPELGSRFFLAALLTTGELTPSVHRETIDPCKNCRRCLDACPTVALIEPYVLDARRCLNYWTIEHQGEIPPEIAEKLGGRFFGCDTCQDICPQNVCPWNRTKTQTENRERLDPRKIEPAEFARLILGTPLERKFNR